MHAEFDVMEPPSRRLIDAQVMATGGKSYPKMGTDGTGWAVLQRLGHSLKAPYPALTPLKGSHPGGAQLAGEAEDSNYTSKADGGERCIIAQCQVARQGAVDCKASRSSKQQSGRAWPFRRRHRVPMPTWHSSRGANSFL